MSAIKANHFAGGVAVQKGHGAPDLATILRDVADDLADSGGATADWQSALAVTTDVLIMTRPGAVIAVEGTTGNTTGVKSQQFSGSPATLFCTVVYTAGVPTITFNGTDAITVAAVMQESTPAAVRTTKA